MKRTRLGTTTAVGRRDGHTARHKEQTTKEPDYDKNNVHDAGRPGDSSGRNARREGEQHNMNDTYGDGKRDAETGGRKDTNTDKRTKSNQDKDEDVHPPVRCCYLATSALSDLSHRPAEIQLTEHLTDPVGALRHASYTGRV